MRDVIDLRSDTVTKPTPGMRRAIAEAEVGDEQKREDPTVTRLQERVAALLGQEAALFVPTASMANQIALKLHTRPGDVLVAEEHSHVLVFEYGGGCGTRRTHDARTSRSRRADLVGAAAGGRSAEHEGS